MRLSSRLSDKSKNSGEIESFINWEKYTTVKEEETEEIRFISAGDFIEIQIGTITLPFYSTACKDSVSFISPKRIQIPLTPLFMSLSTSPENNPSKKMGYFFLFYY